MDFRHVDAFRALMLTRTTTKAAQVLGTSQSAVSRLVADLGETCNLTMLHETEVLYLDRMEAPWPLRLDLKPGSHVPAHSSASGVTRLSAFARLVGADRG